ncbi:MAG TPA: dephospho-CoA kinase [Bdellovibrionales bacterium]|nr:dephospho-CoA kinase [Bdellovibrionales bacterium]
MKWIGLTGNLGSGKSTVAQMIREEGYSVLDADREARLALGPGSPLLKLVKEKFGPDLFDSQGNLDRKALGKKVFSSPENLRWLEKLIHPEVRSRVEKQRQELEKKGEVLAFYDVPLLDEKKMETLFDGVVVVSASPEFRQQRVSQRDGLSEGDFLERDQNQLSMEDKVKRADWVLKNEGSLEDLRVQIQDLLKTLVEV